MDKGKLGGGGGGVDLTTWDLNQCLYNARSAWIVSSLTDWQASKPYIHTNNCASISRESVYDRIKGLSAPTEKGAIS